MNIVHLFCYPGSGGSEKYALYLTEEAQKENNHTTFIFGQSGSMIQELENRNLKYNIINMPSWFNIKSIFLLKKYFKENKTDIVHTHFLREHFLSVFAKIFGSKIKVVRTFHRLDQLPLKVRPFYKFFQIKTNAIIAVSDYLTKEMIKNGIKPNKITTIYNGTPQVKVKKHNKAIGYLGRLSSEKGILKLIKENIKYFKEKDSSKLLIAGIGPEYDDISDIININNLEKIELLGQVSNLSDYFSKISILIHPTEAESTLSLSLIESISSGVPVVTFNIPPLNTLINDNFGILVEKNKYVELLELSNKLLNENNRLLRMSKACINEYHNKYTVEKMWAKTSLLYKNI